MRRAITILLALLIILSQCPAALAAEAGGEDEHAESLEPAVSGEEDPGSGAAEDADGDADPNASADVASFRFAKVNTGKGTLNMRKQGKDGAKVVAKLPNGSFVQVLSPGEKWSKVAFGAKTGYVMNSFLAALDELPYQTLRPGDKGPAVKELKSKLKDYGYLTRKQVNERYDEDTEKAVRKLELLNGLMETGIAEPELQAFLFWGKVEKSKSGSGASNTDKDSGLTASIFAWTSGYVPEEGTGRVEVIVHYATQASGGREPYTTVVKRTYNYEDGPGAGDTVKDRFKVMWSRGLSAVYLIVTVTDADDNRVSAKVRVDIKPQAPPDFGGAID